MKTTKAQISFFKVNTITSPRFIKLKGSRNYANESYVKEIYSQLFNALHNGQVTRKENFLHFLHHWKGTLGVL